MVCYGIFNWGSSAWHSRRVYERIRLFIDSNCFASPDKAAAKLNRDQIPLPGSPFAPFLIVDISSTFERLYLFNKHRRTKPKNSLLRSPLELKEKQLTCVLHFNDENNVFIGESLLTSSFTFLLISQYELTHQRCHRMHKSNSQVERVGKFEQVVQFSALCNQYSIRK